MKFSRSLSSFCILFFAFGLGSQTTYTINDPLDLENRTYIPGDEIILANGTYDSDERIRFLGSGTADKPIIFRAENPGGVKFTGGLRLNIAGDHLKVDGFYWKGGFGASNFIQFRNGTDYANYSTIQNCVIDGLAIHPDDIAEDMADNAITKHRWVVLYGTNNTVAHCSFMNKSSAGALILAELQYNAEADRCSTVNHTITRNYFYKYDKIDNSLSNSGDSETIRLGSSDDQNVNCHSIVSDNYFVESDGENEIITNKSKGNTFVNNTFRRCRGSLVLRHGSAATVEGNYFLGENVDGTGGIRISDSDHVISNNCIQDCITVESQAKWNNGITFLGGGDTPDASCSQSSTTNGYQRSENLTITNNSIVNTNAPLFFNTSKGKTSPAGIFTRNIIYFVPENSNASDILSGDATDAYVDIGTLLTYEENVYQGADLGATNEGFSLAQDLNASAVGEIYIFSGSSAEGMGADMGDYEPITDNMVGTDIGACFLNHLGENFTDGDCIITVGDQLTTANSSVPVFPVPATNMLYISNSQQMDLIILYTIDGKKVMEIPRSMLTNSNTMIDVSSLSEGVYLLVLAGKQSSNAQMIMISR